MSVLAKIRWLKPGEGGRVAPPRGPRYSTVAKFEAQTEEEWRRDAWSLVLNLEGTPDETLSQTAWVRFLAGEEKAPVEWLRPCSTFALFEGPKKVAEGTVLEIGDGRPARFHASSPPAPDQESASYRATSEKAAKSQ